jgi:hypothetical protein
MGRVFTIEFSYEEQAERALVRMYEQGYDILFKVHVMNDKLHEVLPEGNLEFSYSEGLKTPNEIKDPKGKELVNRITEAISNFLKGESLTFIDRYK